MVILLQGASDIARLSLANQIVQANDDWRHLSIENVMDIVSQLGMEVDEDEPFLTQLACQCAQEMQGDGFHLVMTLPAVEDIDEFKEDVGGSCLVVHFASKQDKGSENHDLIIDGSKKSVKDAYMMLKELIEKE
jgi:hypothetical protein